MKYLFGTIYFLLGLVALFYVHYFAHAYGGNIIGVVTSLTASCFFYLLSAIYFGFLSEQKLPVALQFSRFSYDKKALLVAGLLLVPVCLFILQLAWVLSSTKIFGRHG